MNRLTKKMKTYDFRDLTDDTIDPLQQQKMIMSPRQMTGRSLYNSIIPSNKKSNGRSRSSLSDSKRVTKRLSINDFLSSDDTDFPMETETDTYEEEYPSFSNYEVYLGLTKRVQRYKNDRKIFEKLEKDIFDEIRRHPYYEYCTLLELLYCKEVRNDKDVYFRGRFGIPIDYYYENDNFVYGPCDFDKNIDPITRWKELVSPEYHDFIEFLPHRRLYNFKADPFYSSIIMEKILTNFVNKNFDSNLNNQKLYPLIDTTCLFRRFGRYRIQINNELLDRLTSRIKNLEVDDYFNCVSTHAFQTESMDDCAHMITVFVHVKRPNPTDIDIYLMGVDNVNWDDGDWRDYKTYWKETVQKFESSIESHNDLSFYEVRVYGDYYYKPRLELNIGQSNPFEYDGYCMCVSYFFVFLMIKLCERNIYSHHEQIIVAIKRIYGFGYEMLNLTNEKNDTSVWYILIKNFTTKVLLDTYESEAQNKHGKSLEEFIFGRDNFMLGKNPTFQNLDVKDEEYKIFKSIYDEEVYDSEEDESLKVYDETDVIPGEKNNYYFFFLTMLSQNQNMHTIFGISLLNDDEDEDETTSQRMELYVPNRDNLEYFKPHLEKDKTYDKWKDFWIKGPVLEFVPLKGTPFKLFLKHEGIIQKNTLTGLEIMHVNFIIHGFPINFID
jgi:hypothetical protein